MRTEDNYLAEITGMAVGTQNGLRRGHEAGYTEGWNDAVAQMEPRFQQLQQEVAALSYAMNGLGLIAYAALAGLDQAPRAHQIIAMNKYGDLVTKNRQVLRHSPHLDPILLAREKQAAEWFPKLYERLQTKPVHDFSPEASP
ncbi:MAG: hypothetical protein ACREO8_11525 [Luteimonas sp.]